MHISLRKLTLSPILGALHGRLHVAELQDVSIKLTSNELRE